MALATVEIRTTMLPEISIDLDEGGPAGEVSWIVKLLRPSVSVKSPIGSYTRAPWGDPGETNWPLGAIVLIAAIGLVLIALIHSISRK